MTNDKPSILIQKVNLTDIAGQSDIPFMIGESSALSGSINKNINLDSTTRSAPFAKLPAYSNYIHFNSSLFNPNSTTDIQKNFGSSV